RERRDRFREPTKPAPSPRCELAGDAEQERPERRLSVELVRDAREQEKCFVREVLRVFVADCSRGEATNRLGVPIVDLAERRQIAFRDARDELGIGRCRLRTNTTDLHWLHRMDASTPSETPAVKTGTVGRFPAIVFGEPTNSGANSPSTARSPRNVRLIAKPP